MPGTFSQDSVSWPEYIFIGKTWRVIVVWTYHQLTILIPKTDLQIIGNIDNNVFI